MALETPVALFVFNRPDLASRVFDQIRAARPRQLLIVADGPRCGAHNDSDLVRATRQVVERIDWNCQVLRNYSSINLGCQRRMSSGLNWVFENVEEAIILEDDCLPSIDFFEYCHQLLVRYRKDPRVVAISGTKVHCPQTTSDYSYFFSKYFHCWGWASWRRVWQHYDVQMCAWPQAYRGGLLKQISDSRDEECYWGRILDKQFRGHFDAWAYQMVFNCWQLGGWTAIPSTNLVTNIGFDHRGTHTHDGNHHLAAAGTDELGALRHPPRMERHVAADREMFRHAFAPDLVGLRRWRLRARPYWRRALLKSWQSALTTS